tara:strand:+ start:848 stop:1939 length:1092 start_codon:yes stop_codon:yes gene_type:complete
MVRKTGAANPMEPGDNAMNLRHIALNTRTLPAVALLAAGLAVYGLPAHAQSLQPEVEVNLDVLDSLGPPLDETSLDLFGNVTTLSSTGVYNSTVSMPGAVSEDSVLLLPAPDGSAMSSESVLLLEQPATTSSNDFEMPALPEQNSEAEVVSEIMIDPDAELEPFNIVTTETATAPEPEPEMAAEIMEATPKSELLIEPEAVAVAAATSTPEPADTVSAFDEIEDLLSEPVDPEAIEVPEPDLTMDGTDVAVVTSINAASTSDDLQILFETESDALSDADRALLQGLAGQLDANPDQRVQLRAFASSEGTSASDSRRLALSRALAVRAYLIENNVRSTRIDVRALGDKAEEGPMDRIDIVLVDR